MAVIPLHSLGLRRNPARESDRENQIVPHPLPNSSEEPPTPAAQATAIFRPEASLAAALAGSQEEQLCVTAK